MKIVTINFSGNTGKTTLSRHLLHPRVKDAHIFSVESSNADGNEDHIMKGKRYSQLIQAVSLVESCVVDVGSSNAEDFLWQMNQYSGSHEDFDYFVIPCAGKAKQIHDTIKTIFELSQIGVNKNRIKVVFNNVEYDDVISEIFEPIYDYNKQHKSFSLCKTPIHTNEIYQLLARHNVTIEKLVKDDTDYKAKIVETKDANERLFLVEMLGLKRLSIGAQKELDTVFKELVAA